MARFCARCGGPLHDTSRFCKACGAPTHQNSHSSPLTPTGTDRAHLPQSTPPVHAPAPGGKSVGPGRYILGSIRGAIDGAKLLLKQPRLLIPTIVLSVIWALLGYLKLLLPDSMLVFVASLVTFAQGGMYGGFLGAVGGIAGKALVSCVVTAALAPVLTGQKPPPKSKTAPASKQPGGTPWLLGGIGCALMTYHLLTGNGGLENAAIGVMAFLACRRQRDGGFLPGLLLSLDGGRRTRAGLRPLIGGLTSGFLIGVGLSLLQIGRFCAGIGILLAIVALAAVIATGNRGNACA